MKHKKAKLEIEEGEYLITPGSKESMHIVVEYKGKKITNKVTAMVVLGGLE